MSVISNVRPVILTVAALFATGLASTSAQAQGFSPITGRWEAQTPGGSSYYHFKPSYGTTPDGALVGRFFHGEIRYGGAEFVRAQGQYFVRWVGPKRFLVTLQFDDGRVVTVFDHLITWNQMNIKHGPRHLAFFRQDPRPW